MLPVDDVEGVGVVVVAVPVEVEEDVVVHVGGFARLAGCWTATKMRPNSWFAFA